jgi:16S rRNA (guanine527-N7)-methyltransferase
MGDAHLERIVEANRHFNLTRITTPREAAIKHIVDSVVPWRLFSSAAIVLDAGTGAGFPGIPLAVVLPSVRFILSESIGKKARFVDAAVKDLGLANVQVVPVRAEEILRSTRAEVITARAVAPIARTAALFAPALKAGVRALLYKGPDIDAEIAEAAAELRRFRLCCAVIDRYELPDNLGFRTIVEMKTR